MLTDATVPHYRVHGTAPQGVTHSQSMAGALHCRAACRDEKAGYTPDCLTETTADTALALLLVTARRIPEAMAAVRCVCVCAECRDCVWFENDRAVSRQCKCEMWSIY